LKRHPDLRDLSDDHHAALVIARRCVRSARPGAAASADELRGEVLAAFAAQLEPHFEIEERHLLPALEAIGEGSLAERVRADHARLRALVAGLEAERLESFGALLEGHVRFEEREVFEVAQARLPEAALRAIAEACRTRRPA
jgi:hemerythrin-like domain-containing protein